MDLKIVSNFIITFFILLIIYIKTGFPVKQILIEQALIRINFTQIENITFDCIKHSVGGRFTVIPRIFKYLGVIRTCIKQLVQVVPTLSAP